MLRILAPAGRSVCGAIRSIRLPPPPIRSIRLLHPALRGIVQALRQHRNPRRDKGISVVDVGVLFLDDWIDWMYECVNVYR